MMTRPGQVLHRLIFFGDSVCVGQGVSIHRGWVLRIAARIDELAVGTNREIVVVNASANGRTTRQALERMPYEVQSHEPTVLLLQFGMNDCNYWLTDRGLPRVSPKAFAANLEEIMARGLKSGANKVLVNTNHPTLRDQEPMQNTEITYEESNRIYNNLIREVAAGQDERVVLNDVESCFMRHAGGNRENLKELLLDDGLHLSVRGHDIYYDLILPSVEMALKERSE